MKKILTIIMTISIILGAVSIANADTTIPDNSIDVVIDGMVLSVPEDMQTFFDINGRTQTSVRAIGEGVGGKVMWDGEKQQAIITKGDTTVVFTIGSYQYTVNGVEKSMDSVAIVKNGRVFVPVRFLSESLGYKVGYFLNHGQVLISKKSHIVTLELGGTTGTSTDSAVVSGTPMIDLSKNQAIKDMVNSLSGDVLDYDQYMINYQGPKDNRFSAIRDKGFYYIIVKCDQNGDLPSTEVWNAVKTVMINTSEDGSTLFGIYKQGFETFYGSKSNSDEVIKRITDWENNNVGKWVVVGNSQYQFQFESFGLAFYYRGAK